MKMIIAVALALVAVAAAAPGAVVEEPIKIISSTYEQQPDGPYQFGFETQNGIVRNEQGLLKEALDDDNKPHKVITIQGSYTYPGVDGPETINYSADETGYHAEGRSIPKARR